MAVKDKIIIWIISIIVVGAFLSAIKGILLPFVVALIVAYFLDPAVDKIEEYGPPRWLATVLMIIVFFAIVIAASLLLVPLFAEQISSLAAQVPGYIKIAQEELIPVVAAYLNDVDPQAIAKVQANIGNISGYVLGYIGEVASGIWESGVAFLNILSLLFITPVVVYYLLRDWDLMVEKINSWLPHKHAKTIRTQIARIDNVLSGYLRGQINVCLMLGAFYAIGLSLVGLEFGFVIGLMTGILSFIPYVGLLFGMAIGLIVAFFQFSGADGVFNIGLVVVIFAVGQFIEGNFVTPRLIGNKVGLHPAWIMFGMLAGAALFGFVGVLLAVPVTAVIGVLVRFALEQYLASAIYKPKPAVKKTKKSKATSRKKIA